MYNSLFDIFKIGIGPSSSHTVGPIISSNYFLEELTTKKILPNVVEIQVELYGSLAYTGIGHKTHDAIIVGLNGKKPDEIFKNDFKNIINDNIINKIISVDSHNIKFSHKNITENKNKLMAFHNNALKYKAILKNKESFTKIYYSIGGGFIVTENEKKSTSCVTYNFKNAHNLLDLCKKHNQTISDLIISNECEIYKSNKNNNYRDKN